MASTSDLDRVTMIVLRYMRRPVFVLVFAYALGVLGMGLIPGQEIDGETQYMSLFHAFYFFTYTATTTGFGEIPAAFSDEQRLWAVFCLFIGVIAWLYAIGSMISLVQNPHFVSAVSQWRLARLVRKIPTPFFIICGFGDTGSLLARGLSDHYMQAVVLDTDEERIKALALRDYKTRMPGLCADATVPKHLINAGMQQSNCKTVLVLTGSEDINLKISVMARYLNPKVRILCRSSSTRHQEHLQELGSVTVIDPFELLADSMQLAITRPLLQNLTGWLDRAKGVELGRPFQVPMGHWIICGCGRFGRWLDSKFESGHIPTSIIDPQAEGEVAAAQLIMSDADYDALCKSGIESAAGIIAATNRDASNLGILMTARRLNPGLFTVVRQNDHANQPVFDAARATHIVQASLSTARRQLMELTSSLIRQLLDWLSQTDPVATERLVERLRQMVGEEVPHLWQIEVNPQAASALWERLEGNRSAGAGEAVSVGAILRDPHDAETSLQCAALVIGRADGTKMLPTDQERLSVNDTVLICGTGRSKRLLDANLNNRYTLEYILTGIDPPRGHLFRWLARHGRGRLPSAGSAA